MAFDLTDPRDEPERGFFHPVTTALYGDEVAPLLFPNEALASEHWAEAARRWHEEILPQMIVEGHVIDRGPGYQARGHIARYAYAEPAREAAQQELILRNGG